MSRRGKGRLVFERDFREQSFRLVFLDRCGFLRRKGDLLGGMGRNYLVGLFSEAYWREVSRVVFHYVTSGQSHLTCDDTYLFRGLHIRRPASSSFIIPSEIVRANLLLRCEMGYETYEKQW